MPKYECKHAYDAEGARYICCDLEEKPKEGDRASTFHALCAFQKFCPERRCVMLTAGYAECRKPVLKALEKAAASEQKDGRESTNTKKKQKNG